MFFLRSYISILVALSACLTMTSCSLIGLGSGPTSNLSSLTVSSGSLSPAFSPTIYFYTVTTSASSITISATNQDPGGWTSGTGTFTLQDGFNEFILDSYGSDYSSSTYYVDVTSGAGEPLSLASDGSWVSGNLAAGDTVWYEVTATPGTYSVWWDDSYEGTYTKTADIEVQAYMADGTTALWSDSVDSGYLTAQTVTVPSGATAFRLKVTGYSSSSSGSFAIKALRNSSIGVIVY